MELSAVSNPSNSTGAGHSSQSALMILVDPSSTQISLVYKRRRYNTASGPSSPKEDVQPLLSSQSLNDSRVISEMASTSSQAIAQGNSKGKEVVLPRLPSVQDFANALSFEQVTEDKLIAKPSLETRLTKERAAVRVRDFMPDNRSNWKRDEVARDDRCASTSSAPPGPAPAQTKKKTPQKKLASKKKKKPGVPAVRSLRSWLAI
ncbi:hypothetical protein GUJ93_ZPchr0009g2291 [Zizania palustris]|uniref:Uncharacterized protein n=1 Tax=Zizania palustris TaxID=103762 RepID=A0A8J5RQQ5_ZIZPA|nr:hypothetical protein GUJ93_ZPchr0009g2291 [Zizania palustris]